MIDLTGHCHSLFTTLTINRYQEVLLQEEKRRNKLHDYKHINSKEMSIENEYYETH